MILYMHLRALHPPAAANVKLKHDLPTGMPLSMLDITIPHTSRVLAYHTIDGCVAQGFRLHALWMEEQSKKSHENDQRLHRGLLSKDIDADT